MQPPRGGLVRPSGEFSAVFTDTYKKPEQVVSLVVEIPPGIVVRDLVKRPDDRGFVMEVLRTDWGEILAGGSPPQANVSWSHPGVIRAWHRHARGQNDFLVVLEGKVRVCTYDDLPGSRTGGRIGDVLVSSDRPQLVRIDGRFWHGTRSMGPQASLTLYFVSRLYDYDSPDEERRPWDDPTIMDPATGKSFDWKQDPKS